MMRWLVCGAFMLGAAACAEQRTMSYRELERLANDQQREAISRPAPDTCEMAAHQNLIGMDGSAIDQTSLPANSRVVCHECAVTLDYRADRLNVELGPDGKVVRLRCG